MPNPIPDFDHNLVLPPHLGDPTRAQQLSPYPCTTVDICDRFGTSPERRALLSNLLDFRDQLRAAGLVNGFQWIDGSFLENIEATQYRVPRDIDLVTVYWGYDKAFLQNLASRFPAFASARLAKQLFKLDHYSIDASFSPMTVVENVRYWALLFSHNRDGVWKGMLKIEIDTPSDDAAARQKLAGAQP